MIGGLVAIDLRYPLPACFLSLLMVLSRLRHYPFFLVFVIRIIHPIAICVTCVEDTIGANSHSSPPSNFNLLVSFKITQTNISTWLHAETWDIVGVCASYVSCSVSKLAKACVRLGFPWVSSACSKIGVRYAFNITTCLLSLLLWKRRNDWGWRVVYERK